MELSEIKSNEERRPHKNTYKAGSHDIVEKKHSLFKRFVDDIKPETVESIVSYVAFKVIVPAILNTIHDALVSSIDIFFTGSPRRESGKRRYWNTDGDYDYSSVGRTYGRKTSDHDYFRSSISRNRGADYRDYLTFRSNLSATQVWDSLQAYIDEEGYASVEDLYSIIDRDDLCGWNDSSIGWTSLNGTRIRQVGRDRYELILPRLEKL